MMKLASYFLAGLLFAIGLVVGGMTEPKNVIGFLDVTGNWNPSLAFVMAGAVSVHALTYRLVRRLRSPLFAPRFLVPQRSDIDARLVIGGAIFGAGWGLGGYCPGPALVASGGFVLEALLFVATTLLGQWLFGKFDRWLSQRGSARNASQATETPIAFPNGPKSLA